MKKIFLLVIGFILLLTINVHAEENNKVIIYVFRGSGCTHCYDALEYLAYHEDEFKDFAEVQTYEIWGNEQNEKLMKLVKSRFDFEKEGVPFIVVGDSFYRYGFADSYGKEIINEAKNLANDGNYNDVVEKVIAENNMQEEVVKTSFVQALEEENINIEEKKSEEKKSAVISIIVGVLVALVASVFLLRKSND